MPGRRCRRAIIGGAGLQSDRGEAVKSKSTRRGLSALPARTAAAVLVLLGMVGLQPTAGATTGGGTPPAPQGQRPKVTTCGSSACDWAEFHQNTYLTGVAPDSTVSTANASQLGVAWA